MKKLLGGVLSLVALAGLLAAPVGANAQQTDPRSQIIPVIELDQADLRDALKIIFRAVGLSYSVASDVQGTVTVSLKDVPFETALRNVLNQVDATYRIEGGVYAIIRKPAAATIRPETALDPNIARRQTNFPRKIYIKHADPALIAALLNMAADVNWPPEISNGGRIGGVSGDQGLGGLGSGGLGGGTAGGSGGAGGGSRPGGSAGGGPGF